MGTFLKRAGIYVLQELLCFVRGETPRARRARNNTLWVLLGVVLTLALQASVAQLGYFFWPEGRRVVAAVLGLEHDLSLRRTLAGLDDEINGFAQSAGATTVDREPVDTRALRQLRAATARAVPAIQDIGLLAADLDHALAEAEVATVAREPVATLLRRQVQALVERTKTLRSSQATFLAAANEIRQIAESIQGRASDAGVTVLDHIRALRGHAQELGTLRAQMPRLRRRDAILPTSENINQLWAVAHGPPAIAQSGDTVSDHRLNQAIVIRLPPAVSRQEEEIFSAAVIRALPADPDSGLAHQCTVMVRQQFALLQGWSTTSSRVLSLHRNRGAMLVTLDREGAPMFLVLVELESVVSESTAEGSYVCRLRARAWQSPSP